MSDAPIAPDDTPAPERCEIHAEDLGSWTVGYHAERGWYVRTPSAILAIGVSRSQAHAIAAAPALLRFLSLIARNPSHPVWVDLDRVLQLCGIRLVP